MTWIILAILVAGLIIANANKKSSDDKNAILLASENAKLEQRRKEHAQEVKLALENSPIYQQQVNASLQYVEYLEEYATYENTQLSNQIYLLKNPSLGMDEKNKTEKLVKEATEEKHELQDKWFSKWDKLDRQLDPRHALLVSDSLVGMKYERYQKTEKRIKKLYDEFHELKKHKQVNPV